MAELPTFTICPQYAKGYKKDLIKEKYNLTVTDIRKFKYPSYLKNSRQFFYEVTYNISEFVAAVEITTKVTLQNSKYRKLLLQIKSTNIEASDGNDYDHEKFFRIVNWVNFGQCFTLKINEDIKKRMVKTQKISCPK